MSAVRYSDTPTPIRTAEDYEKARAAGARIQFRFTDRGGWITPSHTPFKYDPAKPYDTPHRDDQYRAFYPAREDLPLARRAWAAYREARAKIGSSRNLADELDNINAALLAERELDALLGYAAPGALPPIPVPTTKD